jgi:hypothetical protein
MTFRAMSPVVRLAIIEEIAQEGSSSYITGHVAVALTLSITLAELHNIVDESAAVWRTEDIPKHLLQLKALNPNAPVDPDIPEPGAVFWACYFLKSRSLPLSLVYRYFTSQHPVQPPPHALPDSTSLAIDYANRGRPLQTPATPTSSASDSSLEWCSGVEEPELGHPWLVGHRAREDERQRSIGYEIRKVTQECLADRASNATMGVQEFADREVIVGPSNKPLPPRI